MNPASPRMAFVSCFLSIFLLVTTAVNAQQQSKNKPGRSSSSSNIKTEHISIDFKTTKELKSIENGRQTPKGVEAVDADQQAILLSKEIAIPVDSVCSVFSDWQPLDTRWIDRGA